MRYHVTIIHKETKDGHYVAYDGTSDQKSREMLRTCQHIAEVGKATLDINYAHADTMGTYRYIKGRIEELAIDNPKNHPTCDVCGLIRYSEETHTKGDYDLTDKFCTCNSNSAVKSELSPTLRKHLEWAWNYAIAESYREYTTKEIAQEIAQEIADGVMRGEDAEDGALLEDFARNWVYEDGRVCEDWLPESASDVTQLSELLVPIFDMIRKENEAGLEPEDEHERRTR